MSLFLIHAYLDLNIMQVLQGFFWNDPSGLWNIWWFRHYLI